MTKDCDGVLEEEVPFWNGSEAYGYEALDTQAIRKDQRESMFLKTQHPPPSRWTYSSIVSAGEGTDLFWVLGQLYVCAPEQDAVKTGRRESLLARSERY